MRDVFPNEAHYRLIPKLRQVSFPFLAWRRRPIPLPPAVPVFSGVFAESMASPARRCLGGVSLVPVPSGRETECGRESGWAWVCETNVLRARKRRAALAFKSTYLTLVLVLRHACLCVLLSCAWRLCGDFSPVCLLRACRESLCSVKLVRAQGECLGIWRR